MDSDDKKSLAMFGFRRSGIRNKKAARAILLISLLVIALAVWFVIFRH
ncbi:hypothetical protein [Asticcacaulis sp. YBE204]|nr:hypothetical protein [Asticcacaulis sp. YBE204]ESQ77347.1 hypothetical protein AEYBE204_17630 [Asticcacaulis sp. YBE204]